MPGKRSADSWFVVPLNLFDAELFSRFGAEALGRPRRSPDNIDGAVADAGQLLQARFHLRTDVDVLGATLSRERHIDGDILLFVVGRREVHLVNQAKVDNIDRDFRIIATPERA